MFNQSRMIALYAVPISVGGLFISSTLPAQARADQYTTTIRSERHLLRIERRENARNYPAPSVDNFHRYLTPVASDDRKQRVHLYRDRVDIQVNAFAHHSQIILDGGDTQNVSHGVDLDLTSTERNIKLGSNLFKDGQQSVKVSVDGQVRELSAGSDVTAAEYVALQQVLSGGTQQLKLGANGSAAGGQVLLDVLSDAGSKIHASSLTVAAGVDVIGNFSRSAQFRVKGDLVNFGQVYALARGSKNDGASIAAKTIVNQEGALITSCTDALNFGFGQGDKSLDLSLKSDDSFVNYGTITSSGNLTISAGNVSNSGSSATLGAHNNVSINSSAILNSGLISAQRGDVGLSAANGLSLYVNNEGGTISSAKGAINIRESGYDGNASTDLRGGNWVSREINVFGGGGGLTVDVKQLTGALTAFAGSAFITTDTDNLYVKQLCASGDPLIKNHGDITQGSISTSGGPLTIIAEGDINIIAGSTLSTASSSADAGDILLVAGANFEDPNPTHPGQTWILGASTSGGNINGSSVTFDASSPNNSGGDLGLIAFDSSTFTKGQIKLDSTSSITTNGTSVNGNVQIIGSSVNIGTINTNGTAASGGNVLVSTRPPALVGSEIRINDTTGAVVSGSITEGAPSATPTPGDITAFGISAGGNLTLNSQHDVFLSGNNSGESVVINAVQGLKMNPGSSIQARQGMNINVATAPGTTKIDPTIIEDLQTLNGDLNLVVGRGALKVLSSSLIEANQGNVLIQNAGASKKDRITIGNDVTINGLNGGSGSGSGNVTIATGALPGSIVPGTAPSPKRVTPSEQGGGNILWGVNPISVKKGITVTAKGADVRFNNTLTSKKGIALGKNVHILADPPIAGDTAPAPQPSAFASSDNSHSRSGENKPARIEPSALQAGETSEIVNTAPDQSSLIRLASPVSAVLSTETIASTWNAESSAILLRQLNSTIKPIETEFFFCGNDNLHLPNINQFVPKVENNIIQLKTGRVVFAPDQQTSLQTPFGTIHIAAGCLVVVAVNHCSLSVYNLVDRKCGDVSVTVGNTVHNAAPGCCMYICPQNYTFEDINALPKVGHRNIVERSCSTNLKKITGQYSMQHTLGSMEPLKTLLQSRHPQARTLCARLLKTMAVLLHMGAESEEYQYYRASSEFDLALGK